MRKFITIALCCASVVHAVSSAAATVKADTGSILAGIWRARHLNGTVEYLIMGPTTKGRPGQFFSCRITEWQLVERVVGYWHVQRTPLQAGGSLKRLYFAWRDPFHWRPHSLGRRTREYVIGRITADRLVVVGVTPFNQFTQFVRVSRGSQPLARIPTLCGSVDNWSR